MNIGRKEIKLGGTIVASAVVVMGVSNKLEAAVTAISNVGGKILGTIGANVVMAPVMFGAMYVCAKAIDEYHYADYYDNEKEMNRK